MAKNRDGISPYPEHCFDESGGSQMDPKYSCCWCGVEEQEWEKSGHGPLFKGSGKLVNHAGETCPVRVRDQPAPPRPDE